MTPAQQLQKEIKQFFVYMYPKGPPNARAHADMIRVAIGGAFSMQKVFIENEKDPVVQMEMASVALDITEAFEYTTEIDWVPRKDWQWWPDPTTDPGSPEMN